MIKVIASLIVGLVGGFSLSLLLVEPQQSAPDASTVDNTVALVDCVCDVHGVRELDRAVHDQRVVNSQLREEIDQLLAELGRLENERIAAHDSTMGFSAGDGWLEHAWTDLAADYEPDDRRQMLIDGGFGPVRAEWILARESELQMAAVEEHLDDSAAVGAVDYLDSRIAARHALREEIGGFEYEQYLAATGQSTKVSITQVIADSPAYDAGFQVGDEIIDYDGKRVFNMIELADKTRDGAAGGTVIVNVTRDGSPMQLVLPRGPLGVSGGIAASRPPGTYARPHAGNPWHLGQ